MRIRTGFNCLLVIGTALCCTGCERNPATDGGTVPPSPRQTIEKLIATRQAGTYQDMRQLVIPDRVEQVTQTLMAVDDFLHANRTLCNYVRKHCTLGLSQSIDQSRFGYHLGIFSTFVEVLDQTVNDREATVSYMVDGQLPLRRARLVLLDNRWHYDPGPGYDPQLVRAFEQMTRGLRQVLQDLKDGRIAADDLRANPELLIEEVRIRLLPGIKLLPATPTTRASNNPAP